MDRLKSDWFPQFPDCLWKTDALQFGFQPHAVAYVIMVIGIVASILIFGGEKCVRRSNDVRGNQLNTQEMLQKTS